MTGCSAAASTRMYSSCGTCFAERAQVVEDLQGGRLGQRPPLLVAREVLAPAHGLAVGSGVRPTPTNA